MNRQLSAYIKDLEGFVSQIPDERKEQLRKISDAIRAKRCCGSPAKVTFICTHNSRRSHLCQIWTATLAEYLGLDDVQTFSGGTEVTAFNLRAVDALKRVGFTVEYPGGENPNYRLFFDDKSEPLLCFSKAFDDASNPKENYVAVMTCTEADRNCPVVTGASLRFKLPYRDPGEADGTSEETQVYDERCKEIATEMLYLMSKV